MENITKLQKDVKNLEGLRLEVVQLEEKTAQNKADSADLRKSVDENHKKFVVEQEQNHILANRSKHKYVNNLLLRQGANFSYLGRIETP